MSRRPADPFIIWNSLVSVRKIKGKRAKFNLGKKKKKRKARNEKHKTRLGIYAHVRILNQDVPIKSGKNGNKMREMYQYNTKFKKRSKKKVTQGKLCD